MKHLRLLTAVVAALLCVACGEDDDCYYCGKDISGGLIPDKDVPVITKESDKPIPDTAVVPDDEETPDEVSDADGIQPGDMVLIEAATFMMGCEENVDPNCIETNSLPQHTVSVLGFEIDRYEVTKKEYEACIEAEACKNDVEHEKILYNVKDANNPFCVLKGPLAGSFPANCISWEGAKTYCAWVDKRLPTEAEWELAARGTDGRRYPWGDTPPPSCDNTVMDAGTASDTSWGCGSGLSRPIGSKPDGASPSGLLDMAGNMYEWVEDDWHETYDDTGLETPRPDNGTAWIDTARPPNRVVRGGSFMLNSNDFFMFTTYAHYGGVATDPGVSRGFRCAR